MRECGGYAGCAGVSPWLYGRIFDPFDLLGTYGINDEGQTYWGDYLDAFLSLGPTAHGEHYWLLPPPQTQNPEAPPQQTEQQCETAAVAEQNQDSFNSFMYGVKEAGRHVVDGAVGGAVTGCLASLEAGCLPGAGPGAVTGVIGGLFWGMYDVGYYGFHGIYTTEKQLTRDLAVCKESGG